MDHKMNCEDFKKNIGTATPSPSEVGSGWDCVIRLSYQQHDAKPRFAQTILILQLFHLLLSSLHTSALSH